MLYRAEDTQLKRQVFGASREIVAERQSGLLPASIGAGFGFFSY
jgi:hypothetical protein